MFKLNPTDGTNVHLQIQTTEETTEEVPEEASSGAKRIEHD